MDRNTILGFVLIGLVLMIWMWMNAPPPPKPNIATDTTKSSTITVRIDSSEQKAREAGTETLFSSRDTLGKFFGGLTSGVEKTFIVEGEKFRARISTRGGTIRSWELVGYKTWDQYPVNLINNDHEGDFNLLMSTVDGKLVNTRSLIFRCPLPDGDVIKLGLQDSARVELVLDLGNGSRVVKTLIFSGGGYSFDAEYRFERMSNVIANYEYQVTWESGLRYAERNSIDESNSAMAGALAGGEFSELDARSLTEPVKQNLSGRVQWVATRNKYFAVAMIPRTVESQGAFMEGTRIPEPDNGAQENYSLALKMPFLGKDLEVSRFTVFLGPLDFDVVNSYKVGLDQMMSLGAAWIIRPISEHVMIPLFQFLRMFIPNYGFVIIVFSIIIKVVLYPLTKSSMSSMRKMQALQPMMTEIREKHKDDPQKMNQQIMRLYKEYGVNPAGGCLPLLLQLPILYALWAVFRSTIDLRQASFVWWIHDLSIPDMITKLPFRLPLFNIDELSGLALLMGITMFVQQKMSVKDPRQKAMVWMMPIMMTLLFNSFPSGLNLYYFVFNLLSIGQQAWFNRQHKDEPLRKVEEKKGSGGILARLAKDIPKMK